MTPFTYSRACDAADALARSHLGRTKYLGAGTNLIDLMRQGVEQPEELVDVTGLSQLVVETADGGLLIGAATSNSVVAEHHAVRTRYPVLSQAILAGASAQIRNVATVAGNVLQRTRCSYFYDVRGSRCNKRVAGQGCDAIGGFNRSHAILGASSQCIATHPSDMCVALVALDAVVHLEGPTGARRIRLADLHCLPGETPHIETVLRAGELVAAVGLPPLPVAARSTYRKVRDRASYAFALVSVAAALETRDGRVHDVRLAMGGVAHKPWRAHAAERALLGQPAGVAAFAHAAEMELADAKVYGGNAFKPELARRTLVAVLNELAGPHA